MERKQGCGPEKKETKLSKTLLILIKYTLNYSYAKYQVYLIIFYLIMPNQSLLLCIFHIFLIKQNTCTASYPGLQHT